MAASLVDVNVWMALYVDSHVHHRLCHEWYATVGPREAAFCRITQMGFLRHLTTPAIMHGKPLSQRAAWQAYESILALPETVFLREPEALFDQTWKGLTSSPLPSNKHWTDAYLTTFARLHHLTLVTLDRTLAKSDPKHLWLSPGV
ncbi:MAG: hypothetical protein K2X03_07965 [Bryobacteraceae bacterium]|nr:hypothetical protein [Bryobacteraceae bacterium]